MKNETAYKVSTHTLLIVDSFYNNDFSYLALILLQNDDKIKRQRSFPLDSSFMSRRLPYHIIRLKLNNRYT